MSVEIERKFLISGDFKKDAYSHEVIMQGYLSSVEERTVRIRTKGGKAYITVKGISNQSGTTRYEWEKEISINDAHELIKLCEPGVIDKVRYYVQCGDYTIEVDEFHGENEGLIVAEIELLNENDIFDKPDWLGEEVTGDNRYYNSSLIKSPYTQWGEISDI